MFHVTSYQFTLVITSLSCLAGLLFGLVTAIVAGAGPLMMADLSLTDLQYSVIVSVLLLFAGSAAWSTSDLSNRWGRKKTLTLSAVLYLIASIGCALSGSFYQLILFRAVLGIALGMSSFTAPMYIAEIAPKEHRGQFVIMNSMAITGGMLLAYLINIALMDITQGWRWMLGCSAMPAALLGLGMMILPESPRWLLLKGKKIEAQQVLTRLRGDIQVELELKDIIESLPQQKVTMNTLFSVPYRKLMLMGLSLAVMQQITGINIIFYYTPMLFEQAGFHGTALLWIPVLAGGTNFVMTAVALKVVDRVGRRPLLKAGYIGMIVSLLMVVVALGGHPPQHGVMVVASLSFIACFAVSIGCLFWLLISEIYPTHLRARAMGMMTATNWFTNFLVSLSFLPMMQALGLKLTFAFYAFACMMSLILASKIVPETKSVTLESIQHNLLQGKRLREIGAPL